MSPENQNPSSDIACCRDDVVGTASTFPANDRARAGQSNPVDNLVVITQNLPADLPVSAAELAVLETYLGDIVDAILDEIERDSEVARRRRSNSERLGKK